MPHMLCSSTCIAPEGQGWMELSDLVGQLLPFYKQTERGKDLPKVAELVSDKTQTTCFLS